MEKISITTQKEKDELLKLFKSFNCKKEIYEFYNCCANTQNLNYINYLAKEIGFDFSYYKEKKKKYCINCGRELTGCQKKFCSTNCSATYNNKNRHHTFETKKKISESLKSKEKPTERKKYYKKLREKIIENKIKDYKCECCGISEWNGKAITLHLHHIDGNHFNNDLNNLQLLCPNCHSQTENFCSKNRKKQKIKYYCKNCGKEIKNEGRFSLCRECYNKSHNMSKCPPKEQLQEDLKILVTYKNIAEKYGVNPSTIRKWLFRANLL